MQVACRSPIHSSLDCLSRYGGTVWSSSRGSRATALFSFRAFAVRFSIRFRPYGVRHRWRGYLFSTKNALGRREIGKVSSALGVLEKVLCGEENATLPREKKDGPSRRGRPIRKTRTVWTAVT